VFWLSLKLLSKTFLLLRTERDMIRNVDWSSCTGPIILARFQWNLNFLNKFSKILKYEISRKYVRWEPRCSTWMDGQTDREPGCSYQLLLAISQTRLKICSWTEVQIQNSWQYLSMRLKIRHFTHLNFVKRDIALHHIPGVAITWLAHQWYDSPQLPLTK